MIMGVVLALLGVFSIANAGLTFISMAFPIGVILTIIGITECISYRSRDEDEEDRHWVLIDGLTTFILGIVVLTGQLAADIAVPVIFGMWSMIAGIRYLVIITHVDIKEEKNLDFYWTVVVAVCNFVTGLYTFFNASLFNLSVLMMLGIIFVIQGINVIKVGFDTTYKKPDLIKTKEELHALLQEIDEYFRTKLKLRIKGNYQIFPSFIRGVDFVGYRVFKDYTLLRKSTCLEFERKMTAIRAKVEGGKQMNYSEWCSIQSYKGWLKWCDSSQLYKTYIVPVQPYADDYYIKNIKGKKSKKGGKKDDKSRKSQECEAA